MTQTDTAWVKLNPLTQTYDTPDGTKVPAEMLPPPITGLDILAVAILRAKQREQMNQMKEKS